MIKTATVFLCIECGAEQAKWAGQCTVCNAWNTIVEETIDRSGDRPTPTQLRPDGAAQ